MKTRIAAIIAPLLLAALIPGAAVTKPNDVTTDYPISGVLDDPEYRAKLPPGVRYYFGDQPAPVSRLIAPTRTSRRTSNGKGPVVACRWAMLSALIAIGEDAQAKGGNAVVGIKSNYNNIPMSSAHSFRCGIGGLMVGVALIGDIAVVE